MRTRKKSPSLLAVLTAFALAAGGLGCAASNTEKGAVIGAGAGAVIGGVIGNQAGNTAVGAIMGAVVGGTAGAIIGNYMDRQAKELEEDLADAEVERVGEGIKITFGSGLLFEVDQASLTPDARSNLVRMSETLRKYDDTNILIEGHTDATGTDSYNQDLSQRRAQTVKAFLAAQNVSAPRMTTIGYGESQPVASNDSSSGRQANRRVEVAIFANEELKQSAAQQAAG